MNENTKKMLPALLIAAVVIAMMATNLVRGVKERKETQEEPQNEYAEVPEAEPVDITESKSDAYMASRHSSSIEDYWDSCDTGQEPEDDEEERHDGIGERGSGAGASSDELFGHSQPPERAYSGGVAPVYRESPEEREERHKRRREEAIEMAMTMQQGLDAPETAVEETEEAEAERITIPSGSGARGGVISSLDDGWNNGGISTLGSDATPFPDDDSHPYKCMFMKDEKIKNGGRVSIRLLEDLAIGGTLIPKNTHLMATCSISDRLCLEVTSIEMGGHIYPMGYEAYDMDGNKGIYCPETGKAAGTVRSKGATMVGSTLSSQVGRLASDIVNTGISIVHSAGGETTVSVPSGYTFFMVKKKRQ